MRCARQSSSFELAILLNDAENSVSFQYSFNSHGLGWSNRLAEQNEVLFLIVVKSRFFQFIQQVNKTFRTTADAASEFGTAFSAISHASSEALVSRIVWNVRHSFLNDLKRIVYIRIFFSTAYFSGTDSDVGLERRMEIICATTEMAISSGRIA
jgi:hypothetical protein